MFLFFFFFLVTDTRILDKEVRKGMFKTFLSKTNLESTTAIICFIQKHSIEHILYEASIQLKTMTEIYVQGCSVLKV